MHRRRGALLCWFIPSLVSRPPKNLHYLGPEGNPIPSGDKNTTVPDKPDCKLLDAGAVACLLPLSLSYESPTITRGNPTPTSAQRFQHSYHAVSTLQRAYFNELLLSFFSPRIHAYRH